jgi:hypothetical protein
MATIDVTEIEARRIIQALQDRVDLYKQTLSIVTPSGGGKGMKGDIAFLGTLIENIKRQAKI